MSNQPVVSIVITTKNEEKHIGNCLDAIFSQSSINFTYEVFVIDNFSTDNTEKISKQYPVDFHLCGPERNAQRNYGLLNLANGDYLIWIDADHIIHPLLIECCVHYMQSSPNTASLMLPEIILGSSLFAKSRRFERQFYEGTPIDGSRFIRADSFKKCGGFSSEWLHGPDDWDLDLSLKKFGNIELLKTYKSSGEKFRDKIIDQFNIDPDLYPVAKLHNESNLTLRTHLRKKAHYSADFEKYIQKWGVNHPSIKKQIGLKYRYITVFFENGKWRLILQHPILFLTVLFNKTLVGAVFLMNRRKP